jgi:hypothetical protein
MEGSRIKTEISPIFFLFFVPLKKNPMGLASTPLILKNPRKPELSGVSASSLAGTGPVHLCIPEHARIQLEPDDFDNKVITPNLK